jgi:hypothetical protein
MRGCTLVVAVAGGDPPPLEILVERLVQQLQTHINDLKFCTNRAEYEKQGRMKSPAIPYRVRGVDLDEQRRDQQHQQRAPTHHRLSLSISRSPRFLESFLQPQSGASAGGKRGIGYKRRALRCNERSRYVGRGKGRGRSFNPPVRPDGARKMVCGDLFWPMRECGTWCKPMGECHVRCVTPWSCMTPRRTLIVNICARWDPGKVGHTCQTDGEFRGVVAPATLYHKTSKCNFLNEIKIKEK